MNGLHYKGGQIQFNLKFFRRVAPIIFPGQDLINNLEKRFIGERLRHKCIGFDLFENAFGFVFGTTGEDDANVGANFSKRGDGRPSIHERHVEIGNDRLNFSWIFGELRDGFRTAAGN